MFEGVSDQFRQFLASRTTTPPPPLPLPLSFPPLHSPSSNHHHNNNNFSTAFDAYPTPPAPQHVPLPPNFLHPLHQSPPQPTTRKNKGKVEEEEEDNNNMMINMNLEIERKSLVPQSVDPWSNEEILALLRIRSSFENWFPEFTWEHVSSKLAELGFKRSAEKCKEKFEEESRYFINSSDGVDYSKDNYRAFSELEELYHGDQNHSHHEEIAAANNKEMDKPGDEGEEGKDKVEQNLEGIDPRKRDNGKEVEKSMRSKKRKRKEKAFGIFKRFCEDVVRKMIAQQEEMHNKLLEDMIKRDEEKAAREEAWKKQKMDRMNKEIEARARDQALAGYRQATIIEFLKKFTSSSSSSDDLSLEAVNISGTPSTSTSSSLPLGQNPSHSSQFNNQNPTSLPSKNNPIPPIPFSLSQHPQKLPTTSSTSLATQNPNSQKPQDDTSSTPKSSTTTLPTQKVATEPTSTSSDKEDTGKRWPRDEVLALINLRSSLYNSNEDKEGAASNKAPLWERMSRGMLELGYKRSAKRCKEKWENINKYFRKTKDLNKKRSLDSRTCPYFHQLSTLYSQGTLSSAPENRPDFPGTGQGPSSTNGSSNSRMYNVAEGEKTMVQVPGLEFEF